MTVIADREKVIGRLQSTRDFANEIVDLAVFVPILGAAHRIFVRDLIGSDDVKNEHVDRRIIEPLPRFSINESVAFE